jgi:hypothetical protein
VACCGGWCPCRGVVGSAHPVIVWVGSGWGGSSLSLWVLSSMHWGTGLEEGILVYDAQQWPLGFCECFCNLGWAAAVVAHGSR